MLMLALLAVIVVPKVLNPASVEGAASVAPPPPPPSAGDCLLEPFSGYTDSDSGRVQTDPAPTFVACTESHGAEIHRIVDVLPPSAGRDGLTAAEHFMGDCWSDLHAEGRIAGTTLHWQWALELQLGVIGPDHRQSAAGQQWAACTVGLSRGEPLTTTFDQLVRNGDPALGSCGRVEPTQGWAMSVPCNEPHDLEWVGYLGIDPGSQLTQDEVDADCTALVTASTGRDAPTTADGIRVATDTTAWYTSADSQSVALPLPPDAAGGWTSCEIRTDGRMLVGSLRRLGDAPLPWAP